jgi:hypothetical protein
MYHQRGCLLGGNDSDNERNSRVTRSRFGTGEMCRFRDDELILGRGAMGKVANDGQTVHLLVTGFHDHEDRRAK